MTVFLGRIVRLVGLLVLLTGGQLVWAQDSTTAAPDTARPWYENAWTTIVEREGVAFSYIFYSEADTKDSGLVLRLLNRNEYAVRYDFTVVFRGPEGEEATASARGTLEAGEMKTGADDGLFWIPFRDGQRIGEVGLRGIEVTRLPGDQAPGG